MGYNHISPIGAAVHLSKFLLGDLKRSGVYFLYHNEELVYVGQTRTLKYRLEQHLSERRKVFDAVAFIPCTIDRLMVIESHYIAKCAPKYNHCNIAKSVREAATWQRARPTRENIETIDAADVEFNLYEAADFLDLDEGDLANWRKAGLLPRLSLAECLNFIPDIHRISSTNSAQKVE